MLPSEKESTFLINYDYKNLLRLSYLLLWFKALYYKKSDFIVFKNDLQVGEDSIKKKNVIKGDDKYRKGRKSMKDHISK